MSEDRTHPFKKNALRMLKFLIGADNLLDLRKDIVIDKQFGYLTRNYVEPLQGSFQPFLISHELSLLNQYRGLVAETQRLRAGYPTLFVGMGAGAPARCGLWLFPEIVVTRAAIMGSLR